jgi:DnaJ-class molecular chaperone
MAKVVEVCNECGGKGHRSRRSDDILWTKPDLKGVLNTYPDQLCDPCGGSGKVIVDRQISEK